jgi:hypothetical protein
VCRGGNDFLFDRWGSVVLPGIKIEVKGDKKEKNTLKYF